MPLSMKHRRHVLVATVAWPELPHGQAEQQVENTEVP
jgi:hypothetical protein